MPNWSDLLEEVKAAGSTHDVIRRRYLAALHELTGRNVIIYYSGWLQKSQLPANVFMVNDDDKNGFMATIHELDRSKGLDLILHTPGGETAATESLVDYLRSMFGTDIRAIVPQLAMSAGTMIALSCSEVVMGKHSSLGPIDPQFGGIAAHGIVEEFNRAKTEIQANPLMVHVWQPIIAKYQPTFIGECEKSMKWSEEMVDEWLKTGMFADDPDRDAKAEKVVQELGDHALMKSHGRHIALKKARDIGITVVALEDDDALQEAVLSVHHACIQSLAGTGAVKIIENQNGVGYLTMAQQMAFLSPVTGAAQQ
jgi:ClpP class serine protease